MNSYSIIGSLCNIWNIKPYREVIFSIQKAGYPVSFYLLFFFILAPQYMYNRSNDSKDVGLLFQLFVETVIIV